MHEHDNADDSNERGKSVEEVKCVIHPSITHFLRACRKFILANKLCQWHSYNMNTQVISVVELPPFSRNAKDLLSASEILALKEELSASPLKGVVIPATGGIRKLRVAAKGKGKRGGARVIYYYYVLKQHVYLMTCYGKNEKEDISPQEKKILRGIVEMLKGSER
jgi:mRNA-degrading endonuclease RelE of RelBE toxin-antitoxin system